MIAGHCAGLGLAVTRLARILVLAGVSIGLACAQIESSDSAEVEVLPVQGNVYLLAGAGGNITVQTGKDGVLLVDAGQESFAERVFAEIRKLSNRPLRYIIDTNAFEDHAGGNDKLAKRGSTIAAGNIVIPIGEEGSRATIIAHENVSKWMNAPPEGNQPKFPFSALPTDTYVLEEKDMIFNGEAVQMFHRPAANTDGDTIVLFRRSDVVSTGDIFSTDRYPKIDLARGGNVQGVIDGLNFVLDLTVPGDKQEGGTIVIPGHGRLCDESDVVEYRDMVTIVRDRIRDMIKKGMTLEQVKAASPTRDYDPLYGSDHGPWTTDMFVAAVYNSLKSGK